MKDNITPPTPDELEAYNYATSNSIFYPMHIKTWELSGLEISRYIEIYDYLKKEKNNEKI